MLPSSFLSASMLRSCNWTACRSLEMRWRYFSASACSSGNGAGAPLPYAIRASARNFSSAESSSLSTLRRSSSRPFCVSASTRGNPGGETGLSARRAVRSGTLAPPPPPFPCRLKNASLPEAVTHLYKPLLMRTGLLLHPDSRAFSASDAAAPSNAASAPANAQHHASARQHEFPATASTRPIMRPSVTAVPRRQKGRVIGPPLLVPATDYAMKSARLSLQAVIHLVFHRMRRHPKPRDLFHLECDIRVDHIVGEYASAGQELSVPVEIVECLVERCTRMRHLRGLLRLEVIQILVDRIARMDLVVHAVQSRHQHRGKREIR